jgi:hypothetical protein
MIDERADRYLKKMRKLGWGGGEKHIARVNDLLARIKAKLPQLEEWWLHEETEQHYGEENAVYRFYHQSFKVFHLQDATLAGLRLIEEIGGETDPPYYWYTDIVKAGTQGKFTESTNANWMAETRPILEAFWHTKYFIQMLIKYGKELEQNPEILQGMDFGWAAVLYLFELR